MSKTCQFPISPKSIQRIELLPLELHFFVAIWIYIMMKYYMIVREEEKWLLGWTRYTPLPRRSPYVRQRIQIACRGPQRWMITTSLSQWGGVAHTSYPSTRLKGPWIPTNFSRKVGSIFVACMSDVCLLSMDLFWSSRLCQVALSYFLI